MKFPQFVPILTAFTARVAGRELGQLLQSPSALARALADTQTVVGHDGVLCVFDPTLLSSACLAQQCEMTFSADSSGVELTPAEKIGQTAPLAAILESIQPLRHLLPESARIYATFSGPGLLYSQLQDGFESSGRNSVADMDYVVDVIMGVVRSSLDLKADGIALIEQPESALPSDLMRCHKKVRKLADFYDAGFLVFSLLNGEEPAPEFPAHCIFKLPSGKNELGLVPGQPGHAADSKTALFTTTGDVPETTPIEELKALLLEGRAA